MEVQIMKFIEYSHRHAEVKKEYKGIYRENDSVFRSIGLANGL